MHRFRVSSSNCSSEVPHSGHESSSRSPSRGSLSVLLSNTLSKDRVEVLRNSLGFELLRCSPLLIESEPSTLPGLLMSISRVSRLLVESMETRKLKKGVNGLFTSLFALKKGSSERWQRSLLRLHQLARAVNLPFINFNLINSLRFHMLDDTTQLLL